MDSDNNPNNHLLQLKISNIKFATIISYYYQDLTIKQIHHQLKQYQIKIINNLKTKLLINNKDINFNTFIYYLWLC